MTDTEKHYIQCACEGNDHVMTLEVDNADPTSKALGFEDSVIVGYQLPRTPFLYRLRFAVQYIFGFNPRSHWNDMIIEREQAVKIISILSEIVDYDGHFSEK